MNQLRRLWLVLLIVLSGSVLEGMIRFGDFTIAAESSAAFNVSRGADGWITIAHPENADAFIQGRVVGSNLEIGMVNVPGSMQGQGLSTALYQALVNEAGGVSSITGELAFTNKMILQDGLDAGLSLQEAAEA